MASLAARNSATGQRCAELVPGLLCHGPPPRGCYGFILKSVWARGLVHPVRAEFGKPPLHRRPHPSHQAIWIFRRRRPGDPRCPGWVVWPSGTALAGYSKTTTNRAMNWRIDIFHKRSSTTIVMRHGFPSGGRESATDRGTGIPRELRLSPRASAGAPFRRHVGLRPRVHGADRPLRDLRFGLPGLRRHGRPDLSRRAGGDALHGELVRADGEGLPDGRIRLQLREPRNRAAGRIRRGLGDPARLHPRAEPFVRGRGILDERDRDRHSDLRSGWSCSSSSTPSSTTSASRSPRP